MDKIIPNQTAIITLFKLRKCIYIKILCLHIQVHSLQSFNLNEYRFFVLHNGTLGAGRYETVTLVRDTFKDRRL
jgi:hypothetical protein